VPVQIVEDGITKKSIQFEDRPEIGLVVNVSDDAEGIEEGDVVFFGKYSTTQVTHNAVQYQIVRVDDIYCVAKP
jgi:co-chaperonin GroES (HSP10)